MAATQHAADEQESLANKARGIALSALPAPLKRADLDTEHAQLPKGAEAAIEASAEMLRGRRHNLSALISTAKSLQGRIKSSARRSTSSKPSLGSS